MSKTKLGQKTAFNTLEIEKSNCFDRVNAKLRTIMYIYQTSQKKGKQKKPEEQKNLQSPGKMNCDSTLFSHGPVTGPGKFSENPPTTHTDL